MAVESEARSRAAASRAEARGRGGASGGASARHRLAVVALWLLVVLVLAVLVGPTIGAALGLDGSSVDLFNRMAPPGLAHRSAPTSSAAIS